MTNNPLPPKPHEVLGVASDAPLEAVEAAHRRKLKSLGVAATIGHGPAQDALTDLNAARDAMRKLISRAGPPGSASSQEIDPVRWGHSSDNLAAALRNRLNTFQPLHAAGEATAISDFAEAVGSVLDKRTAWKAESKIVDPVMMLVMRYSESPACYKLLADTLGDCGSVVQKQGLVRVLKAHPVMAEAPSGSPASLAQVVGRILKSRPELGRDAAIAEPIRAFVARYPDEPSVQALAGWVRQKAGAGNKAEALVLKPVGPRFYET